MFPFHGPSSSSIPLAPMSSSSLPTSIQVSSSSTDSCPSNSSCTSPTPSMDPPSLDPTPSPSLPPARRHPMRTRSQNAIHKPKPLPTDFIPKPPTKAFSTSTGPLEVEPTCFTLTPKSPHWREAMNAEFITLMRNGTWSLVPCKPTMNLVGCK